MFTLVSCTGGEPEEPISTGATGSSVKQVACSVITVDETGEFVIEDEKGNVGLKLDSGGLSVINDLITRNEKNYVMMRVKEFLLDKDAFFVNL